MKPLSFLSQRFSSSLNRDEHDPRSAYLKFYINETTPALLSMKNLQEAAVLQSRLLTTMPNMPPYILGLTNRRSKVIWVLDLSQMIGLMPISSINQQLDALVVKIGGFFSALAVYKVEGIIRVDPDDISTAPSHLSPDLVPFLEGCLMQDKTAFLILDAEALAQSPLLHHV